MCLAFGVQAASGALFADSCSSVPQPEGNWQHWLHSQFLATWCASNFLCKTLSLTTTVCYSPLPHRDRDEDLPRRINEKADAKTRAQLAIAEKEATTDGSKSAIQRAIEIQANAESQELGVAAL